MGVENTLKHLEKKKPEMIFSEKEVEEIKRISHNEVMNTLFFIAIMFIVVVVISILLVVYG